MNCNTWIIVVLCVIQQSSSFSISSIRASHGEDIRRPAHSGEDAPDIELTCQVQLNPGDHWTSCTWSHEFQDVWGLSNQLGYVMCTVSNVDNYDKECRDVGNLVMGQYGNYDYENEWVGDYVDRLTHLSAESYCAIRISKPHANDTGRWVCRVNDNSAGMSGQNTVFRQEIDLYVANKSEAVITEPRPKLGGDNSIKIDITTGDTEIRASCESRYGVPPPELIWYIDDIRNKISDNDARITTTTTTSNNGISGSSIEITKSSISMTINSRSLSSYGIRGEHGFFSFSLGCYPNQEGYFAQTGSYVKNPAEVLVFGKSGSALIFANIYLILLASSAVYTKLF